MHKIIINGANGYVASYFIKELLARNYEVVAFARDSKNIPAVRRVLNVLKKISNKQPLNTDKLQIHSYSLLSENYAIPEDRLKNIFEGDIDFYHFAACLKFSKKDKEEIFETNAGGTENSLKIFLKHASPSSRFFFISTAYSCGKTSVPVKEIFFDDDTGEYRNYYEHSKRAAENIVKKYIDQFGIKAHILRLSQVIGDNISGITTTDYGIFDFVKRIYSFSKKYPRETVRIKVNPNGTQNLISIDNLNRYLLKTTVTQNLPTIINIVGRQSLKNDDIIKCIGTLIPVDLIQEKNLKQEDMTSLERLVAAGMAFTGGYADLNLKFETKNLDALNPAPDDRVKVKSLQKMIEYFIKEQSNTRNDH